MIGFEQYTQLHNEVVKYHSTAVARKVDGGLMWLADGVKVAEFSDGKLVIHKVKI